MSNIPTPNNDALFLALSRTGITLCVAYCDFNEPNRLWTLPTDKGYPYVFLPGVTLGAAGRFNPSVIPLIRRFRPNRVILTGSYALPTIQMLAWWLTLNGTAWWYWAEELNWAPVGFAGRLARRLFRPVLKRANGILAIGKRSAASFRRLGVPDEMIRIYHYYADAEHFTLSDEVRATHRRQIRTRFGIPLDATTFLFAGQLIVRKGVDIILHALARLAKRGVRPWLLIAGDGPEAKSLERLVAELDLTEQVRFAGFVQVPDLPSYAAAADALLVPSRREGWGLVVSEFMAAGLPVVASDVVNSALNLIESGVSGYLFPSEDVDALEQVLFELASSPSLRATMGVRARQAVEEERPSVAAERLVRILLGEP